MPKPCRGRRRRASRRGTILVLFALFLVLLLALVAFAVDCGVIVLAQAQLQNAADAAATAAAGALSDGSSAAITAAQTFAQANTVMGANVSLNTTTDVSLGTWNSTSQTFTALTGSAQSSANAVQVTCTLNQSRGNALTLFFAPIVGFKTANISATAIATVSTVSCGPFIGLQSVQISNGTVLDSYNSSNGAYSSSSAGASGSVCSNGAISVVGGSVVHGNATPGVGQTVTINNGGSVTGTTTALTQAITESAVSTTAAAASNNNKNIPLTSSGTNALDSSNNFLLSNGANLTLPAGTYYFNNMTLAGGSTLSITGQVIIYCAGNVDLSNGTVSNSGGKPVNFQLYVAGSTVNLCGGTALYAVVYAPAAAVTRNNGSNLYGMIVGNSLQVAGGGGLHYDTSLGSINSQASNPQIVK